MTTLNLKTRAEHKAAFNEAINVANLKKEQEAISNGLIAEPIAGQADLDAARECYLDHTEIITAASVAVEEMNSSPEFSSRIKNFGQNLTNEQYKAEGAQLVQDMITSANVAAMLALAKAAGVKAIGIGVAGSFQLVLAGLEKGYEAMVVLPENPYGIINPNQFKTRSWGKITAGVDALASAGISFSFWFTEPQSDGLTGVFADLIWYTGLRFSYLQTFPIPDSMPTRPIKKPDGVFAGFSLRFSLGIEIGGGIFAGLQRVPADSDVGPDIADFNMMTLNLNNPVTGDSSIQLDQESVLDAVVIPPSGGNTEPFQLVQDQTTITISMPDFTSDSLNNLVVNLIDWDQENYNDGSLDLIYRGTSQTWDSNLEFTISGVQSNSNSNAGTSDTVRFSIGSTDSYLTTGTTLSLITLSFAATVTKWNIDLGENCNLAPPPPNYPDASLPISGTNVAAHTPNDTNGTTLLTQFVDSSKARDTTWNVGVNFVQGTSNGNAVPMMQTIIWQDGVPWNSAQQYPGNPKTQLNGTAQDLVSVYYGDDTVFKATAVLTS